MRLQVERIGNLTALILPEELLARLRLSPGDSVQVTEGPDRSIVITPQGDDDEVTLRIARAVMEKYATVLKALAK